MKTYSSKSNARRAAKKVVADIENVEFTKHEDGRWSFAEKVVEAEATAATKGFHKNSKAEKVRQLILKNPEAEVEELAQKILDGGIMDTRLMAKRYANDYRERMIKRGLITVTQDA